ncbi:Uncharacterised protein [Achromobacter xylosoxidans]|nr:Uncharacterised protein [Achromobacter xylosoxidans]
MLVPVLLGAVHVAGREQQRRAVAQRAHQVGQHHVAADGGQHFVELRIQRQELVQLLAARGLGAFAQEGLQALDGLVVAPLRRQLGVQAFQRGAYLDHVVSDRVRQHRHRGAAARLDGDQAFGGQRPQRFAHRDARHAHFLRQAAFDQAIAGREFAAEDALAQLVADDREQLRMLLADLQRGRLRRVYGLRADGRGGHGEQVWRNGYSLHCITGMGSGGRKRVQPAHSALPITPSAPTAQAPSSTARTARGGNRWRRRPDTAKPASRNGARLSARPAW